MFAYDDTIANPPPPTEPVAAPTAPTTTTTLDPNAWYTQPGGPLYQPPPDAPTTPDYFAPLANASGTQLSGALQVNPLSPTSSQTAISGLAALGSAPAGTYGGPSGLAGPSNFFDSNPLVAYANGEYARGVTSLDGWLKGQQDLANSQGKTMSERLRRQRDLAHRAILNRLAARGILRSGDLGYQEGQQAQNFADSSYDINQNVLQQLAGYWQQYLQQKNALRGVVDNAMTTAYQNQTTPENLPTGPVTPMFNGGSLFAPKAAAGMDTIDQYLWGNRR